MNECVEVLLNRLTSYTNLTYSCLWYFYLWLFLGADPGGMNFAFSSMSPAVGLSISYTHKRMWSMQ